MVVGEGGAAPGSRGGSGVGHGRFPLLAGRRDPLSRGYVLWKYAACYARGKVDLSRAECGVWGWGNWEGGEGRGDTVERFT